MNDNSRWMIVGSVDTKVKFYDLEAGPLEVSVAAMKSRVVNGCWPLHWTPFLSALDDSYSLRK